jgi:hypothetical protein
MRLCARELNDAPINMIIDRADQAVHAGVASLSFIDRRWKRGVQIFQLLRRERQ